MRSNPTISVIVPFCNNATTIERCIKSILLHSFQDFELIIINDGSSDGSEDLIKKEFGNDNRIKIIHQDNRGVSVSRNRGIEESSCKYITFCDADDYLGKDWLFGLFAEIGDFDVVFANYINVDEKDSVIKKTEFQNQIIQLNCKRDHLDFVIRQVFQKKCSWTVWSCLFKREIVIENNIRFNENCENFGEDLGFVLEYSLFSKSVKIANENSYYYVTHPESMSARNNETIRMDSMNEISRSFYLRCIKEGYERYSKFLSIIHFLIMYGQYYKLIGKPNYKSLKTEINKIRDQDHYYKMTKGLLRSYKELCLYADKKTAKQILLFTNYCLHGNWERFKIESAIFYKIVK